MGDFQLVDPRGWEYDLHSVYSAYMGHFQLYGIPWYDRSWGVMFESFEEFLSFSWPVIVVTDAWTGRAHVVTRMTSVGAFQKMIKTRFGETLPAVDNILKISPFETGQRHLRTVSDWSSYKKVFSTLPAAAQAAYRVRVKSGEPKAIRELWEKKDKTFLAIDFEWSERNTSSCLEWGYAAVRCGHLDAVGAWPPVPDTNYRKGHYIVAEYVDKLVNRYQPTFPWQYAFGESQVIPKAKLPQIIQAIISSLASPSSESQPNTLVLVAHGASGDLARFEEMKLRIPPNMLIIDTASFERELFNAGYRGPMTDMKSGQARRQGSTLSLGNLLASLKVDVQCTLHNSGNDAMMCLFALQKLLDPENTKVPTMRGRQAQAIPHGYAPSPSPTMMVPTFSIQPWMTYGTSSPIESSPSRSEYRRSVSSGFHYSGDSSRSSSSPKNVNFRDEDVRGGSLRVSAADTRKRESRRLSSLTDEMGRRRDRSTSRDPLPRLGSMRIG
ncbi:hypothetical protein NEOLEDRAFT_1126655 [Neolentinus lepideus HHB14362 ss-1]|uniref:Gfd2/YDR514C-like C-terminal domain-containing protein n=1 Tax=Neolentinus lepideus HHB14362 ss-1 TaxID=1314782 RepID=A0A165WC47_9AGAM|nr:hypothetical protein NEOLEDRAFT_1126655 [Neolentinus lepideus HHB14362 ss-1]